MKGARSVLVAKGKKAQRFEPSGPASWKEIATAVLGPSGNLRAPTLRLGNRWLVGFGAEAWEEELG